MHTRFCEGREWTPRVHAESNPCASGLPRDSLSARVKTKEISGWKAGQEPKSGAEWIVRVELFGLNAINQGGSVVLRARAKVDLDISFAGRLSIPGSRHMVNRDIELVIAQQLCHHPSVSLPAVIERGYNKRLLTGRLEIAKQGLEQDNQGYIKQQYDSGDFQWFFHGIIHSQVSSE